MERSRCSSARAERSRRRLRGSDGAFGGGNGPIALSGPPALTCNYDPTACFDVATNAPLEASPPAPTVAIDYDPSDLAKRKDPLVERAVKVLGF